MSEAGQGASSQVSVFGWCWLTVSLALMVVGAWLWELGYSGLGIGGLALFALSWWWARKNLQGLQVERRLPARAFARELIMVEVVLRAAGDSLHVALQVTDAALNIGRGLTRKVTLFVGAVQAGEPAVRRVSKCFPNRGIYRFEELQVSSPFPLGLFHSEMTVVLPTQVEVYPQPLVAPTLKQWLGSGHEVEHPAAVPQRASMATFHGLRDYAHGDPLRLMAWPATVRLQKPIVRQYDPAMPQRLVIILHTWGPLKEVRQAPAFERLLGILTGLLLALHEQHHEVELVASFLGWKPRVISADAESLYEVLGDLATVRLRRLRDSHKLRQVVRHYRTTHRVMVGSHVAVSKWQPLVQKFCPDARCFDTTVEVDDGDD